MKGAAAEGAAAAVGSKPGGQEGAAEAGSGEGAGADRSSAAAARMRERQEKKAAEQERIRAQNAEHKKKLEGVRAKTDHDPLKSAGD